MAGAITTLGGCASVERWSEFHGNATNTGYVGVNTPNAELPTNKWTQKIGPAGFASPAIAPDGTIYIGDARGHVWGWNPDGTLKQYTEFPTYDALSSMAIGEDGILHYTVMRYLDGGTTVGLYCRTRTIPDLRLLACRDLPDGGITTAPPKIWVYQGSTYAFVPSYRGAQRDLLVFRDGEQVYRHAVDCPADVRGGDSDVWKYILGILTGGWSLAIPGANPFEFKVPGIDRREWHLDPAMGVWDRSAEGRVVLVAAFNGCPVQALEWRPDAGRMTQLWRQTSVATYYSSPAIFSNGTTSIGRDDGHVQTFHALTGTVDWDFDAGDGVLATPAIAPGGDVYVVAFKKAFVVSGWAGGTSTQSFDLPSATQASPALSLNRVYIPHSTGVVTLDHTFAQTQVHDNRITGGLSSPAIGKDGSVYIVSNDGYLFAFK